MDTIDELVAPYQGYPRLDPGLKRAPGDAANLPAAQAVGDTVGEMIIPQTPLDVGLLALGGPLSKAAKTAAVAIGGLLTGSEAEAGPLQAIRKAIRAYHSSPHDFDKFSLDKIGTGEGAQVYGHGLYFAENPRVSGRHGDYWQQFTRKMQNAAEWEASIALQGAGDDAAAAIRALQEDASRFRPDSKRYLDIQDAIDVLKSGKPMPQAKTYEVDIKADPSKFIDWDKPLAKQSTSVDRWLTDVFDSRYGKGFFDEYKRTGSDFKDIYHNFDDVDPARLSAMLNERGIPGIKYLDQGSRPLAGAQEKLARVQREYDQLAANPFLDEAGHATLLRRKQMELNDAKAAAIVQPSHNYVIFDDKLINIVKKYGLAGASLLPPAAAAYLQQHLVPVEGDPFAVQSQ